MNLRYAFEVATLSILLGEYNIWLMFVFTNSSNSRTFSGSMITFLASLTIFRIEITRLGYINNLIPIFMSLLGLISKFLDMLPLCHTTSDSYPSFFTASQRAYTCNTDPKFFKFVRFTMATLFISYI